MIPENDSVSHLIILVTFNNFDERPCGTYYDAHMVGPSGAVTEFPVIVPGIIDVVTGQRNIGFIFFPTANALPKPNLPFTATFRGDNIGLCTGNCHGTGKGSAPVVLWLDQVSLGQRFMGIVNFNDFTVTE